MSYDPQELAEHVAETFADLRLGYVPDGFRFFRRSMREPKRADYHKPSEKYLLDKTPQARWTWVVPRLPRACACACGREFISEKALRVHRRRCVVDSQGNDRPPAE